MTTVLALDIGTKTGWALHQPGMERPFFGTLPLPASPLEVGAPILALHEFLSDRHQMHGGLTDIVFEAQHMGTPGKPDPETGKRKGGIDMNVVYKLCALGGHVEYFAHCVHAKCFKVYIGTWRKHFCGSGRLNRKQAKMSAIDECNRIGIDPPDDNAAEAMGILDYYLSLKRIDGKPYPRPWRDAGFFTPLGHHA
jgi:hypothetical protein